MHDNFGSTNRLGQLRLVVELHGVNALGRAGGRAPIYRHNLMANRQRLGQLLANAAAGANQADLHRLHDRRRQPRNLCWIDVLAAVHPVTG